MEGELFPTIGSFSESDITQARMRAPIAEILLVALAQLPAFSFGVPLGDISTVAHRSSQSSNKAVTTESGT